MGSGSKSKTKNNSVASTYASELSQAQLGILQQREQEYQKYFFPELLSGLENSDSNSEAFKAQFGKTAGEINTTFDANRQRITQGLAQQNMLNSGNGVQAALNQANERARSSALANAYATQLANADANKQNYLQIAAAMSPTPTTSAEYYQTSKSKGGNSQWSATING